jgi:hypothetical protein
MPTRVFSQQPDLVAALPQLLAHARRFFAAEVEVLAASPPDRSQLSDGFVSLQFNGGRYPGLGTFRIESRSTTDEDRASARAAELRGKAGGMAELAARCPRLWTVIPEGDVSGSAELQLCGLLASIALGPVMPADESTLYGVRGAMERAEKAAETAEKAERERH